MYRLVLLRHGESDWNRENRFTGWTDVGLSEKGFREAKEAGRLMREKGFAFDVAFTSVLKRAIQTLNVVLEDMDLQWIPVYKSWRLNERHYGALQGLNKSETARLHGEEKVKLWRRGYNILPPLLTPDDERFPGRDRRYREIPKDEIPLGESLEKTVLRFLPYWHDSISRAIKGGEEVIVAAHGNSLRALVKYLDNVSDADILELNIPTGVPLVYELNDNLRPVRHYYLGNEEAIRDAMNSVAKQGKA